MDNRRNEKNRLFWIVVFALVIGLLTGYYWQALLLALIGYIVWTMSKLFDLYDWISSGSILDKTPHGSGLWGRIIGNIVKVKNQHIKSKLNYKKLMIRFNEILRSFPYPTIVLNANNEMQWISKSAAKMLHLNRKKDTGIRINNIFRHEKLQKILALSESNEFQMISPIDDDITIVLGISKLNKDTRILIIRDVSEKRRLEHTRKTFIANASHEMRTPLTIINGYLEILNSQDLPKDTKNMLANAYKQSQSMILMVESLLTLSNLEDNDNKLPQHELINFEKIIKEVYKNLSIAINISQTVTFAINSKLKVNGVYYQLYSLVFNLIENSIKYSAKNGEIKINWQEVDSKACFQVIDQGKGINKIQINNIIEPFYRIPNTETSAGNGLGLCIVNQVANKNNAKLHINSAHGKGCIFSVKFNNYLLEI